MDPQHSVLGIGVMDDVVRSIAGGDDRRVVDDVGEPAIRMNGLYPGPATAPGCNDFSGNPVGPGTATRVGLKSGAPAKWITAGPKGLAWGEGLSWVTVWTHAGQPIPMFASFGA